MTFMLDVVAEHRRNFALVAQAGVQWCDLSPQQLCLLGSSDSPASASQQAGITDTCHHTWLIFVFLAEIGFHHIGQADLELLTSGHLPALASQIAGITGLLLFQKGNLIQGHEATSSPSRWGFTILVRLVSELLASSDPRSSASKSAGITDRQGLTVLTSLILKFIEDKRQAIEKSVVPWVNDQDVPFCPDCGNKFSIRNRRHHCRLCGSIMCKKCMELISLPLA
ncbi:Rabenosyn-5, partial [Plecturocebus cupreus]